jgi:hypoxanthine phosphoribosyltransferase
MENYWNLSNGLAVFSIVISSLLAWLGISRTQKGNKMTEENLLRQADLVAQEGKVEKIRAELEAEREKLEKESNCVRWRDIYGAATDLSNKLRENGFIPDFIFALSPRGAIIAFCLTEKIGNDNIPIISGITQWVEGGQQSLSNYPNFTANYDDFTNGDGEAQIYFPKSIYQIDGKSDKRILIIEDMARTGSSLRSSKKRFIDNGFNANNIKTMSLVTPEINRREAPDFVWWVVTSNDMYFPWGQVLGGNSKAT